MEFLRSARDLGISHDHLPGIAVIQRIFKDMRCRRVIDQTPAERA